jgi:multiple sugar transport system permease protein
VQQPSGQSPRTRWRRRLGLDLTGEAREDARLGRLMVLPAIAFTAVLVIYPMALGFDTSVHADAPTIGAQSEFVGAENYSDALSTPTVIDSIWQTGRYVALALVLEVVIGMALAVLLYRTFRGRGLVLAILILPWALPSVVSGVLWRRMFDPDTGLLNSVLLDVGILDQPQVWLGNDTWATLFITIVHVWGVIPLVTLVFLAGMQAIPEEVYSASAVDGASPWRQFRHVTFPLLRPSLAVALTVGSVAAINIFDEIYVLNGTALNTRSVLMEVYDMTFVNSQFAQGTALAFLVAVATALLAAFYVLVLRRRTV